MKRRDFLRTAELSGAAVAAVTASGLATPALAAGKRELRLVTAWPKNFPGLGTGAERLAKRITEATEGRIEVRLYAAGELVPAFEAFGAVSSGTADAYHAADNYFQGKHKALNFFSVVPYGFTAVERNAWIYYGGGQDLWDELSGDFGIKPLLAGNTGVQMAGWFRNEINTVNDLQGLKYRTAGLAGDVMRELGAAVMTLPGGEIFPNLQSGALDAGEFVGPWNDLALGFHQVAKYYYWPAVLEPDSGICFGINRDFWESLSTEDRAIITAACAEENNRMLAEYDAHNADALKTLTTRHGVQLRRLPDEIIEKLGEASADVVSAAANEDALSRRIYDHMVNFRKEVMAWDSVATGAYSAARRLALG